MYKERLRSGTKVRRRLGNNFGARIVTERPWGPLRIPPSARQECEMRAAWGITYYTLEDIVFERPDCQDFPSAKPQELSPATQKGAAMTDSLNTKLPQNTKTINNYMMVCCAINTEGKLLYNVCSFSLCILFKRLSIQSVIPPQVSKTWQGDVEWFASARAEDAHIRLYQQAVRNLFLGYP